MKHSGIPLDIAGKHTLRLTFDGIFDGLRVVKVTVLGPPEISGYRKLGAWRLQGGNGWEPNYVLPVRIYRRRIATAYWLGFIASIKKGWSP